MWSPLHTAAASGNLEAAKELIKCGADVGLITCENAAAVHLCNDERLRVFMMWSIVLKEAGDAALVDAINVVRKCGYPPVPEKVHQAKSRYADKAVVKTVSWEVCKSVDAKSFPADMHPLHAAVVCSSLHVVDVLVRSLSNVISQQHLQSLAYCHVSHSIRAGQHLLWFSARTAVALRSRSGFSQSIGATAAGDV